VPSRLLALTFDANSPRRLATFWAGLLDRPTLAASDALLLPGSESQVALRFVPGQTQRSGRPRLHLHLTSAGPEDQQRTVDAALALGATHLDVGQRPEEEHVVLADPEGNEFCVIEPGNGFLAGCGLLGEVACDGTRTVGLFWSEALGWPLVWDQDGETAVQSPYGGTKLAWGGPPVAPKRRRNRQRLELSTTDVGAEADRLVALGATRLAHLDDGVELADPDGNEFGLRAG
jgi:catechol 2,3-dioxygenase-like lactoylglutathione lyase family enzyme